MFHHGVQQNIVNMRELNSWFRYFSNTNMNNEIKNDKDKTIPMYIYNRMQYQALDVLF